MESAGTGAWHEGKGADKRAARTAASRGVDLLNSACPVHLRDRLSLLLEHALGQRVDTTLRRVLD